MSYDDDLNTRMLKSLVEAHKNTAKICEASITMGDDFDERIIQLEKNERLLARRITYLQWTVFFGAFVLLVVASVAI